MATQKATFAAGCFWGVEAEFRMVPGVLATEVGYTGGDTIDPTYEEVSSHTTGHAESVEVDFDPARVTYEALVDRFWQIHDPTQLNRQGMDIGNQYRSVIFTHDDEQADIAKKSLERAQSSHSRPIVTEIVPAGTFYRAEDYHQQYLENRGLASCAIPAPANRSSEIASRGT